MDEEQITKFLGENSPPNEEVPEQEELEELATTVGFASQTAHPSAKVKLRLLAAISPKPSARPDKAEATSQGLHVQRQAQLFWQPTPFAGVFYKPLYLDPLTHMQTLILKLEAGAAYPRHRHMGVEQCLVLSGDVYSEGREALLAGDFEWAYAGSDHDEIRSLGGCELLIITSVHNEMLH